jgi:hypothetical protein
VLLESRFSDDSPVLIDVEAVSSISKGDSAEIISPDDAMNKVLDLSGKVARELASAAAGATGGKPNPSGIEMSFGIRVDSNAVVSVARRMDDAQFHVKVRWGR